MLLLSSHQPSSPSLIKPSAASQKLLASAMPNACLHSYASSFNADFQPSSKRCCKSVCKFCSCMSLTISTLYVSFSGDFSKQMDLQCALLSTETGVWNASSSLSSTLVRELVAAGLPVAPLPRCPWGSRCLSQRRGARSRQRQRGFLQQNYSHIIYRYHIVVNDVDLLSIIWCVDTYYILLM